MKVKIFIALLIIVPGIGFSQDYMDDIALKACDCLSTVSDTLNTERFHMEIGLCMINAANPYIKELKKDYKIDLSKINPTQGEELGRIIGLRMASVCPDAMMKMVGKLNNNSNKNNNSNSVSENSVQGKITAIVDDKFVEFSIKDEQGKISKYYWLTFIESNSDLSANYKTLTDKFVKVTFISQEFFDARIGEYRAFNIIKKLELINK